MGFFLVLSRKLPPFPSFTFPNQSLSLSLCPMKYSLCHATLDTSYHSAVAVHCFMDFVPSLSFLLPSHVYHTRLPSHNSSSRCKKGSSSLFRTRNVRLISDKYDTQCHYLQFYNKTKFNLLGTKVEFLLILRRFLESCLMTRVPTVALATAENALILAATPLNLERRN